MLNAGYHAVPPKMIATVVTSLEMLKPPTLRPEAPGLNWRLDRLAPDPTEYRRLYRVVGEDWLWFSRLLLTDAELAAIIGSIDVEVYRLTDDGDGAGLLVKLPYRFLGAVAAEGGLDLPAGGYGVAMVFLPRDAASRADLRSPDGRRAL